MFEVRQTHNLNTIKIIVSSVFKSRHLLTTVTQEKVPAVMSMMRVLSSNFRIVNLTLVRFLPIALLIHDIPHRNIVEPLNISVQLFVLQNLATNVFYQK